MQPPLICIAGPTASGKSGVAMALALRYPMEIISVDSAQVYRGMDIGTAKPTRQERDRVPHHLLDLIDPENAYSAARFCQDARSAIASVRQRARIPLLVGGTMLYFKALREGLDILPGADPKLRAALESAALEKGWPALHAELAAVDPLTAERLAPTDAQRIQRALEVWMLTGRPLSSHFTAQHERSRETEQFLTIALEPSLRAVLHERIAERFERMLSEGLIEEVRTLRASHALKVGLASMRCVGYRQAWRFLDGDIDESALRATALAATRQLAKRQLTWLRALPDRHSIDCLAPDCFEQVEAILAPLLGRAESPHA